MTDPLKDIVSLFFRLIQLALFIFILIFLILIISKINRGVFKHFYKKDIPRPAVVGHILNSRIRKVMQPPKSIIDALDVKEGMNILEIGAGGETFTLEAARRTRSGTVYATDVSDRMLNVLKSNVRKSKLSNIKIEYADVNALHYEDNTFDRVFMVTVTGELHDKIQAFREINRILKPHGKLTVGEFFIDADYPLQRSVKKWATQAGLKYLKSRQRIIHYTMSFEKLVTNERLAK